MQRKILAIYHDLDAITLRMLTAVAQDPQFEVTIACAEEYLPKVEAPIEAVVIPPIRSKFTWIAIKALRKVIKELRPDVIYSPSTSGLSCALMASLGTKAKNIGYRGTQAKVRRSDPTYYLGILNPRVTHIVCGAPDIEEYLRRFLPERKLSHVVKPFDLSWVDDAMANPLPCPFPESDALRLIFVGISKGRPHKGLGTLIDAMWMLPEGSATLTVIGDADEADMARAPRSVKFIPTRSDAIRFLPNHELFILPSTRDASPRVVREAQACGVPCLVSDIPGPRSLIAPGKTGQLFPSGDSRALADAIIRLASDRPTLQAYAAATRPYIADNFRFDSYVTFYKQLFS
ncbi:MAG: glycosyltransferase [Bacteroidales bacterium]|nr:glycosyltransferase [Bacteroidales bacterium]